MSYLSTRTLSPPPGQIQWDHHAIQPPSWIYTFLPPSNRILLERCQQAAYESVLAQRQLELRFADRYKALCPSSATDPSPDSSSNPSPNPSTPTPTPKTTPANQITHAQSIDGLFNWREDYIPGSPTLAPNAKIPRAAVRFQVDRAAYAAYTEVYNLHLDEYLTGPYTRYRAAVAEVECGVARSTEMRDMDRRMFGRWWGEVFLREMMRWESRITRLRVPTFEVVVEEIADAVRVGVEGGEEGALELGLPLLPGALSLSSFGG
ncbi:uncharacterized protein BO97DRAFT_462928 [Aspergillus homomorphus CBS 101889]|uniref:Uncharacterized protein n=1 Tax=Aspergillus homomorphus (strain CBS 101889) TaxID=1450537 RepID=A0A395I4U9_ASPHC|nr:hypothetical protein BO97DRAFT_462928 [Aspergillus homomorphus CBS 101889]RAL15110.1 hypothetical protein BO97DRAFT_462928 [Aspergillus homomorphus CBS 101889]